MTVAFGIVALLIGEVALPGINPPGMSPSAPSAWQMSPYSSGPGLGQMQGRSQRSSAFGGQSSTGMPMQMPFAPTDPGVGQTVFPMGPDEFASFVPDLIEAGANFIGGCCGTTPEYIRAARKAVDKA